MSSTPSSEGPSRRGMIGLANLGNTCYANAALQAIRHQSDLTMYLLKGKHNELVKRKKASHEVEFTKAYGELIAELWKQDQPGFLRPDGFWKTMLESAEKVGFDHFRFRAPHDSQEFLMFVLDMLHEGMKEEVTMTIRDIPGRDPLVEEGLQKWKQFFEKAYSPLTELLFTLQLNQLSCGRCKTVFNRWETNTMVKVSVPVERKPNGSPYELLDLLKKESEGETIEGYTCDKCGKDASAVRNQYLWRLGSWLIVVLKRNDYTGRRINTPVNIPLTQAFSDLFHPSSTESSSKTSYQLFSVVNHHGGANGGHYTAQARNPLTGQWNLFDDESVHALNAPHLDESAYILMYR
jgi:ubiquitin C-terminal hydrolase